MGTSVSCSEDGKSRCTCCAKGALGVGEALGSCETQADLTDNMSISRSSTALFPIKSIEPSGKMSVHVDAAQDPLDEEAHFVSGSEMTAEMELESDCDHSDFPRRVSTGSDNNFRPNKKRLRKRLMITHTMGLQPSNALQLVIENTYCDVGDHYIHEAVLGEGAFGVVRRAKLKVTGAIRAVKEIAKGKMRKSNHHMLKQEIEIMKLLDHPNLSMLYEIYEDEAAMHLVLELCEGGSLSDFLGKRKKLPEPQAAIVLQQILRATFYLHRHSVCHRDLKSDNCLLASLEPIEQNRVKVSDFGLSIILKKGKCCNLIAGTPTHIAPEVLNKRYKHACDVWSCGVIAYELFCGCLPFTGHSKEQVYAAVKAGVVDFGIGSWEDVSQDAVNFLQGMLTKNPQARSTPKAALTSKWMMLNAPLNDDASMPEGVIEHLQKFRKANKLKRAVFHTIASMLPDEDIRETRNAFILLDTDGDGVFTIDEITAALQREHVRDSRRLKTPDVRRLRQSLQECQEPTEETADSAAINSNHVAGQLGGDDVQGFTYTEFLAATFDRKKAHKDGLYKAAFESFDKNGDNQLTVSELATGRLLGQLEVQEVYDVIEALDLDGDLTIDFKELMHMFTFHRLPDAEEDAESDTAKA